MHLPFGNNDSYKYNCVSFDVTNSIKAFGKQVIILKANWICIHAVLFSTWSGPARSDVLIGFLWLLSEISNILVYACDTLLKNKQGMQEKKKQFLHTGSKIFTTNDFYTCKLVMFNMISSTSIFHQHLL